MSAKHTNYGKQPQNWAFGSMLRPCVLMTVYIADDSYLRISLKNHGVDEEVNEMFDMGAETFALPMEEKMRYYPGDGGGSHGYALVSDSIGFIC